MALLASTSKVAGSGTTTAAIDTTGAKTLVIAVASYDGWSPTVSDSKSNSWTHYGPYVDASSTDQIDIWVASSSSLNVGTGHTATVASTGNAAIAFAAWSSGGGAVDIHKGQAGTSPGSATPAQNNELLITAISDWGNSPTAVSGGFSVAQHVAYVSGTNAALALGYLEQTTAAAANPAWSSGTFQPATLMVSLEAASSAVSLTPSIAATSGASALVTAPALLSPSIAATSAVTALVTALALLAPSIGGTSGLSANVTAPTRLAPSIAATSSVSASATAPALLAPSIASVSSLTATVTAGGVQLAPSIAATSGLTALATAPTFLAPSIAGTSGLTGAVTAPAALSPSIAGVSGLTGAVTARALLAPSVAAVSAMQATATARALLAPSIAGTSGLSAAVYPGAIYLAPSIQATSSVAGTVTAATYLTPSIAATSGLAATVAVISTQYLAPSISATSGLVAVVLAPRASLPGVGNPRSRNPFIYRAWDLTTRTPLDHLPYQGVVFGRTINGPGTWTGSLPIADPSVWNLDWEDASRPSRTLLGVEYRDELIVGYIIWTRVYQESQKVLKIGGSEVGSYMQRRLQAFDYSATWATGGDPMSITDQLMSDALAVYGASQICGGIVVQLNPAGGSGHSVVASYPGSSLQTIDSMIQTLSQMGFTLGIDYSFDVSYIPGTRTPQVVCNIWYPRQGRTFTESQLRVVAAQCLDWYYPEDGSQQANEITEAGSGTGGIQPVTENIQPLQPGYPLLQKVNVHTQVNTQAELVGVAAGDIGLYAWPVVTPWIQLPIPVPDAQDNIDPSTMTLGDFDIGDDLVFAVDPVAVDSTGQPQWTRSNSPRFPAGMSFEWRAQDWTVTVADKGVSTLKIDLGVPPGETQPPPQPPLGGSQIPPPPAVAQYLAPSIAAGSSMGGVVSVRTMLAPSIAAVSGLTAQVTIPGAIENLVLDPSFEYDTTGQAPAVALWAFDSANMTGAAIAVSTGWHASGSKSLHVTGTNLNTSVGQEVQIFTPLSGANAIPVVPGQAYSMCAAVNMISVGGSTTLSVGIFFYDASGTFISGQFNDVYPLTTGVIVPTVANAVAPAGAAFATILIQTQGDTPGAGSLPLQFYLDAVMLSPQTTVPTYADGDTAGWVWTGTPGASISESSGAVNLAPSIVATSGLSATVTAAGAPQLIPSVSAHSALLAVVTARSLLAPSVAAHSVLAAAVTAGSGIVPTPSALSGYTSLVLHDEMNDASGMSGPTNRLSSLWNVGWYTGPSGGIGGSPYRGNGSRSASGGVLNYYDPACIVYPGDSLYVPSGSGGGGNMQFVLKAPILNGSPPTNNGGTTCSTMSGGINSIGINHFCLNPSYSFAGHSALQATCIISPQIVFEVQLKWPGPDSIASGHYWQSMVMYNMGDSDLPSAQIGSNAGSWSQEIDVWEAYDHGSTASDAPAGMSFHAASPDLNVGDAASINGSTIVAGTDLSSAFHTLTFLLDWNNGISIWTDGIATSVQNSYKSQLQAQFAVPMYWLFGFDSISAATSQLTWNGSTLVGRPMCLNYWRVWV